MSDNFIPNLIKTTTEAIEKAIDLAEAAKKPSTPIAPANAAKEPRWMTRAKKEIGVKEFVGPSDNPVVEAYGRDAKVSDFSSDEISWCAWFIGAMLERDGIHGTHSALARSYAQKGWGTALARTELRPGAICILNRPGGAEWQGHVGFVVGSNDTHVFLLGGNQGNKVSVAAFAKSRIVAVKWPKGEPLVGPPSHWMTSTNLSEVSDR